MEEVRIGSKLIPISSLKNQPDSSHWAVRDTPHDPSSHSRKRPGIFLSVCKKPPPLSLSPCSHTAESRTEPISRLSVRKLQAKESPISHLSVAKSLQPATPPCSKTETQVSLSPFPKPSTRKEARKSRLEFATTGHSPTADFLLDCLPETSKPPPVPASKKNDSEKPLPPGARRIDQFFSKSAEIMQ
ncbi:hypothetical protein M5K25_010723 [Dendrobium thyrsiflorum]|uniref:Uncharacterized protein n=1 Tax=Dendrobium thyrsiflorum TaxID=117978 RepID=A0ABD0V0V6_DENTH